ncbi:MAG: hypothetical protein L0Z48_06115, partial [candidate division Zixibacteria bacterium]|nr:hypothetical protein [candidate division Zixibacteria bacterium]
VRPEELTVQIWTHDKELQEYDQFWKGAHSIPMRFTGESDGEANAYFFEGEIPERPGQYDFTVRAAHRSPEEKWMWDWHWAGKNARVKSQSPLWDSETPEALLVRAGRTFVHYLADGTPEIWAAAPPSKWFHEQWGRDAFIALPGLLLTTGRFEEAKKLMRFFAQYEVGGLIPNKIWDPVRASSEEARRLVKEKKDILRWNEDFAATLQGGTGPDSLRDEMKRGRDRLAEIEKQFSHHGLDYNNADASMWFLHAVKKYMEARPEDTAFLEEMLPVMRNIVHYYSRPKEETAAKYYYRDQYHEVYMDQDFLIVTPPQATWMDAHPVGKDPVTPRNGKAVDINALFYGALKFLERAEGKVAAGDRARASRYRDLAQKVRDSFNARFWNAAHEQDKGLTPLFDVVDGDPHGGALRPNMLVAVSHGEDLLARDRQKAVVESATKYLLTPYGLRTLA